MRTMSRGILGVIHHGQCCYTNDTGLELLLELGMSQRCLHDFIVGYVDEV
jgi:hypothetical protein